MFAALRSSRAGLTLVEVMVSVLVILIAVIGIMFSYVKAMELNAIGKGAVIASHAVKSKLEEIKGTTFAQIYPTYNLSTFTITGVNGIGKIYVRNLNARLLEVKVVFCWKLAGGRVIGEDKNLNGQLDTGEDTYRDPGETTGNGEIDSYVQITTQIYD